MGWGGVGAGCVYVCGGRRVTDGCRTAPRRALGQHHRRHAAAELVDRRGGLKGGAREDALGHEGGQAGDGVVHAAGRQVVVVVGDVGLDVPGGRVGRGGFAEPIQDMRGGSKGTPVSTHPLTCRPPRPATPPGHPADPPGRDVADFDAKGAQLHPLDVGVGAQSILGGWGGRGRGGGGDS